MPVFPSATAFLVFFAAVALAAAPVRAAPRSAIVFQGAWARPAAANGVTAGYVTVVNRSGRPDRLTGASSPAAASVSLHESRKVGAVMTMRPAAQVDLPSHATVALAPGGLHLMLMGVRRALRPGDRFAIVLDLAVGGRRRVEFVVSSTPPT